MATTARTKVAKERPPAEKVAVLGGGAAGITAAFELTRPERNGAYDVTVYQLGWRLGGKGASGRNVAMGNRVEEHGLHVWFGFYANAFRMMAEVYDALGRDRDEPLSTIEKAFFGCDSLVLWDKFGEDWEPVRAPMPQRTERPPWESHELPALWKIAEAAARLLRDAALGLLKTMEAPASDVGAVAANYDASVLIAQKNAKLPVDPDDGGIEDFADSLLATKRDMKRRWRKLIESTPTLRLLYCATDLLEAGSRGIKRDRILTDPRGFDAINGIDLRDWFEKHGADKDLTVGRSFAQCTPILRSIYDVAFLFREGDPEDPSAEAGTALNDLLRLCFTYNGHLYYKMAAGMGDAIFAPLYEVLRRRGVKFRFFSAITELRSGKDSVGVDRIEQIDVLRQVELRAGNVEYDPLICVAGLPSWPNEPRWGQLADGGGKGGDRFDKELNPLQRGRGARETLRLGRDFDAAVLAIPVGALDRVCAPLLTLSGHEAFATMVSEGKKASVATQALQLWLTSSREHLGWRFGNKTISATFVEPLDTCSDMSHLLEVETWDLAHGIETIAYFCGVLDQAQAALPGKSQGQVEESNRKFVEKDLHHLMPGGRAWGPGGTFDWNLLFDPQNRKGPARLAAQYHRANTADWERFVTTPEATVRHRLHASQSGFANLALAGDWTRNGINGGSVEAAVMSGIQAARFLLEERDRLPLDDEPLVGEDPCWLNPGRA